MKVKRLDYGMLLEIGDRLKVEPTIGGPYWLVICRLSKKFAFAKVNEVAESKFPRKYTNFGFDSLPRAKWPTTRYSAWRPKP